MSHTLAKDSMNTSAACSQIAEASVEPHPPSEADWKAAQKKLSLFLERSPFAIVEWNPELEILDWNPAAEGIFGYSRSEAIGRSFFNLIVPDVDEAAVAAVVQSLLQQKGAGHHVNQNVTKDGRVITCEWYNTPIENDEGQVVGVISMALDISDRQHLETERQLAQRKLQEQEEFLRSVYTGVDQQIFVFDVSEDGNFYHAGWNTLNEQLVGISNSEALGKTPEEIFGLDLGSQIRQKYICCVQTAAPIRYEESFTIAGETRWFLTKLSPLKNDQGRIYRIVGTALELTDRKLLEQELARQQDYFDAFFAAANVGMAILDEQLRFVRVNRAIAENDGLPIEAYAGRTTSEVLPGVGLLIEPRHRQVLETGQALMNVEVDVENPQFPSEVRHCLESYFPLQTLEGRVIGVGRVVWDVTNQRRAEAALRQAEQQYRSIFEKVSDGIVINDLETGAIVAANPALCQMHGYTYEELIQLQPHEFIAPASLSVFQQYMKTMRLAETFISEAVDIHKDGSLIEIEIKGCMLIYNNKPHALGLIRDITENKLVTRQLQAKAEREQLLNQLTAQIRGSLNFDTIVKTALDEIWQQFQVDRCCFAWYCSDASGSYWEVVQESRHPQIPTNLGHYPTASHSTITDQMLQLQVVEVPDAETEPHPETRQFLQALDIKAILFVPVQMPSGRIGVMRCEHMAQPRDWSTEEIELLQSVMGQLAIALNQADLLAQSQTRAQELQQTLQELQRTQAQMVQSEKMSSLGQLVAGVAHEINNPVSFIYGNINHAETYIRDLLNLIVLYQEHCPNAPALVHEEAEAIDLPFLMTDLPKLLKSMKVGAERIQKIVLSLRSFSRMDEAEMKAVDIHEGIDSTLLILQNRLKANGDRCEIRVIQNYAELPQIECYVGQLNQVFMNILVNAIDALEEEVEKNSRSGLQNPSHWQPSITIQTTFHDASRAATMISTLPKNPVRSFETFVQIRITDNGPGIPAAVQQRLFDPFFTTKPIGKGTGMGLSISYQIITEKHGGVLECYSAVGQGTEFVITLPSHQS